MRRHTIIGQGQLRMWLTVICATVAVMAGPIHPVFGQGTPCEARGKTTMPVKGEIHNNAVMPGTTLGTVHLRIGDKRNGTKMKCGLLGQDQSGIGSTGIAFLHTFVCDDEVQIPGTGETVHSQLTVWTTGAGDFMACPSPPFPPGAVYGSFEEVSVPVPSVLPGRGIFEGLADDEGMIFITGTINCLFSIEMEFEGWVCL